MEITLSIPQEGQDGPARTFDQAIIRMGRDTYECSIVFEQSQWPMASRRHAELYAENGRWYLRDLDSSFGTYLNGVRITGPAEVKVGDWIQCGLAGPIVRVLRIEVSERLDEMTTMASRPLESEDTGSFGAVLSSDGPSLAPLASAPQSAPPPAARLAAPPDLQSAPELSRRPVLQSAPQSAPPPPDLVMQIQFGAPGARPVESQQKPSLFERLREFFRGGISYEIKPVQNDQTTALDEREMAHLAASITHHSASEPAADLVDCSVFAPATVSPGAQLLVQVYIHSPQQAQQAQSYAQEADAETSRRGFKSLETEVPRGTKLTLHLVMQSLKIDEPVQNLVWRGSPEAVKFGVLVPPNSHSGNSIGTVRVSQDGVPVGHIKFQVKIAASDRPVTGARPQAVGEARRYEKAFVSYASSDRDEVIKRVQMLASLRIKFFQDVLELEPGERWERALYRHIDESDLFLLFWSTAAKRSEWVQEEVRYALGRKGGDEFAAPEIIPIIIEGPPPVAPPEELAHLHFDDYLLYFMGR